MLSTLTILAALTGLTLSQPTASATTASPASTVTNAQTTVSVFLPALQATGILGSVVGVKNDLTTYALNCPSSRRCIGIIGTETVTQGPKTWNMALEVSQGSAKTLSRSLECDLDPEKSTAVCHVTAAVGGKTSTTSNTVSDYADVMVPVTITAGADALKAVKETDTAASAEETGSSASQTTGPATDASKTGGAAVPRATNNALFAGAAAIIGGALVL